MTGDVPRPLVQPTGPLRQLMTESWLPLERPRPMEHPASGLRAERRRRPAEAFPGELLVVPTGSCQGPGERHDVPVQARDCLHLARGESGTGRGARRALRRPVRPLPAGAAEPRRRGVVHDLPRRADVRAARDSRRRRSAVASTCCRGEQLEEPKGREARVLRGVDPAVEEALRECGRRRRCAPHLAGRGAPGQGRLGGRAAAGRGRRHCPRLRGRRPWRTGSSTPPTSRRHFR